MWNKEKAHNPFIYVGLQAYLPQHCLYFFPLPHGIILHIFCNNLPISCGILHILCNNFHFLSNIVI